MTKNGQDFNDTLFPDEAAAWQRKEQEIKAELTEMLPHIKLVSEDNTTFKIIEPSLPPEIGLKLIELQTRAIEGDVEVARAEIEALMDQIPGSMTLRFAYVNILLHIDPEDMEEGAYLALYERAITILGINLNVVLIQLDQLGLENIEDVRFPGAFPENSVFLSSLYFLGQEQELMGNYDQAIDLGFIQLQFDVEDVLNVRRRLVDCLLVCEEPQMALKICQDYEEDDSAAMLYGKALAAFMLEKKQATRFLQKAVQKYPLYAYEIAGLEAPENIEEAFEIDLEYAQYLHGLWTDIEGAQKFLKKE
ncbi:MAG TPA: hypothetical protein PLO56_01495, partial [Rhodothermales bacterium]|nr:hypothetical protein [Rhodothermales bacterium]